MKKLVSLFSFILIFYNCNAFAEFTSKGEIHIETRFFNDDNNTATQDYGLGMAARLELDNKSTKVHERLQIFSRVDGKDTGRQIGIVEEAYLEYESGNFQLLVGAQTLNWSATEAWRPADIVNSRNFDSDIENAEKFGEPMIMANYLLENGSLSLFYMPMYLSPKFPVGKNRLSYIPPSQIVGNAIWIERDDEVSSDEYGFQWAIRGEQSFDSIDVSLHVIQHQDRTQPLLYLDPGTGILHGVFLPVTQYGGTYQQALDELVVKLEFAYRDFEGPHNTSIGTFEQKDHSQVAFGLEYGFLHDSSGYESTLLLEGQSYGGITKDEREALGVFQRDYLIGYRLAINDVDSQEYFISAIIDAERSEEYLINFKYSRRLSDVWSFKGGLRITQAGDNAVLLVNNTNQVYFDFARHF